MKKADIIEAITENIKTIECNVVRVYGVPMGVGYDMVVHLTHKNGNVEKLEAHATNRSWSMGGHLRPHQIAFDDYKGSSAPLQYVDAVKRFWESKDGFQEYLSRFKKDNLVDILNNV